MSRRLHAAGRLGSRRALGRQREAGGVLLRARAGLPLHRVRGARDGRARPRAATCSSRARSASSLSSALRRGHEIGEFVSVHGDGVKDISLRVPDANEAYRQAVQRGARGIAEPHVVEDEFGTVELSTIATYGDVVHTFVDRHALRGRVSPGLRHARAEHRHRRRSARARPHRRQRRARPHGALGGVLRAASSG